MNDSPDGLCPASPQRGSTGQDIGLANLHQGFSQKGSQWGGGLQPGREALAGKGVGRVDPPPGSRAPGLRKPLTSMAALYTTSSPAHCSTSKRRTVARLSESSSQYCHHCAFVFSVPLVRMTQLEHEKRVRHISWRRNIQACMCTDKNWRWLS